MSAERNERRLLETLERLLALPAANLVATLSEASDLVAASLGADKVDTFLYDSARDSLCAIGSSAQPLSSLQRHSGLDVLPVTNGGRAVQVFRTGRPFASGRIHEDPEELRGIREALGIRSLIGVPLISPPSPPPARLLLGGSAPPHPPHAPHAPPVRGVLMAAWREADRVDDEDAAFMEAVGRWVSIVAHRAELVEQLAQRAVDEGRRSAAEELVTVLAHDLRNHLAPLHLWLQMIGKRAAQETRERDVKDTEAARRVLGRIVALVDDVLDIARVDHGIFGLRVEAVDLVALLEDVAGALSTPEQAVDVRTAEPSVLAPADPQRLRQCVENILANGIRHSPRGAPVLVNLDRVVEREATWARVEVVDEGPGIEPDLLPRIFDRFVSGRQHAERQGGLGLGLYLAKRIAVLHSGDLAVESAPGRGTRFVLRVPCLT